MSIMALILLSMLLCAQAVITTIVCRALVRAIVQWCIATIRNTPYC